MIKGQELIKIIKENAPDGDDMYFCRLMGIFNDKEKHCAIFCNLSDDFIELQEFLLVSENLERNPFKIYTLLLNSIIEKVNIIKKITGIKESFKNLSKIRKWANFFKHPKSFLLVHYPIYVYGSHIANTTNTILIDTEFISKYYKDKEYDADLKYILTNKVDIEVLVPNLKDLTQGFCDDINKLIGLIKNNQIYINKLMPNNIKIEGYGYTTKSNPR